MKRIGILSDTHGCWDDRYATYFADCDEVGMPATSVTMDS